MHALIDLDIIQYEFGSAKAEDGVSPLAWQLVQSRVDERISNIIEATGATSYQGYLTSDDKSNFRHKIATIKPYKGHRPQEKPLYYYAIRDYLFTKYRAEEVRLMEADDRLGIEQMGVWPKFSKCCICSLDKDLNMIPGWHYNWRNNEKYWVSEVDALRSFYCQVLTGDPTDNIPGLYGIGSKSVLVQQIKESNDELSMYSICRRAYEQRFGSYWEQFLVENAALLWIKRESPRDDNNDYPVAFDFEISSRLDLLKEQYEESKETLEEE